MTHQVLPRINRQDHRSPPYFLYHHSTVSTAAHAPPPPAADGHGYFCSDPHQARQKIPRHSYQTITPPQRQPCGHARPTAEKNRSMAQ